MTTTFGPQLIGETEKTLNALLRRFLAGPGMSEPEWVTMRLADQLDGTVDDDGLAAAVAARAHFPDTHRLVRDLGERGLLDRGRLTPAGRTVLAEVLESSGRVTAGLWTDLPADDVAAAGRVLGEVLTRAKRALG